MTTKQDDLAKDRGKDNGESKAPRTGNSERASVTFSFRNIGPVREADLELGDFTIIAGRNNTGKSYIVYTLYGFLKMWNSWPGIRRFLAGRKKSQADFPDMGEVLERLTHEGKVTISTSSHSLERQRRVILDQLSRDFSRNGISRLFSSKSGDFNDAAISVKVHDVNIDIGGFPPVEIRLPGNGSLLFKREADQLVITLEGPNRTNFPPDLDILVGAGSLVLMLGAFFPEPFILSAERFGISLFYRELDFTKNQLVDLLQKMGNEKDRERYNPFLFLDRTTSRYALPVKDNINYTRSLPDRAKEKSEFHSTKLFNDIKDMMDGYFKTSGDEIRFISKARSPGRKFDVPLHLASSSARGLSDLYFFLKHVAKRNHLLIIDEPESHLDTANQIQLARLLARLVRAGLKVLVTTHSDYLIKEINNLVMLDSDFEGKEEALKSLKYTNDDALNQASIRAYVADNNSLIPCAVDRFGIDMPVFDETIDRINATSNELAARLVPEGD